MNKSQQIGLAAMVLFAISHFLPAFGGYYGYACFQECWKTMTKHDMTDMAGWLYYSGFVLSSVAFVVLASALFLTRKGRFFRLFVSVIILLHTVTWFFANIKGLSNVEVGYYVWLTAYAVLFAAHLTKESNKSVEANRRPAAPRDAGRQFESSSCAPPSRSAAVAHLWRSGNDHQSKRSIMKKFCSILLLAFGVSGCAGPRYQVSVTSVPSSVGLSDWVAIRVDRRTGASWYSYNQAINKTSLKPEWRPISGGTDTPRP